MIQALLSTQNSAYKSALEIFMNQIEDKLHNLQATVGDLTKSLEFTQAEVADLQHQVKQLQKEKNNNEAVIKQLNEDLLVSDSVIKGLEERCNYQEDYSRRKNLKINGIEEADRETWEQSTARVSKLLEERLQLPNIELERVHRVGQRHNNQARPLIARFVRFSDREAVLRNSAKLRGTQIFVNEDLCPASQEIRRAKLPLLKQARSEGKIAYFNYTKLVIKERPTTGSRVTTRHASNRRQSSGEASEAVATVTAADVTGDGSAGGSGGADGSPASTVDDGRPAMDTALAAAGAGAELVSAPLCRPGGKEENTVSQGHSSDSAVGDGRAGVVTSLVPVEVEARQKSAPTSPRGQSTRGRRVTRAHK